MLARIGPGNFYTGGVDTGTGNQEIGYSWSDGSQIAYTQYFHMVPPNGPSCGNWIEGYGIITPSSYHPGGVNLVMLDGSVRFINDNIDAGNQATTVSKRPHTPAGIPKRIWGRRPTESGDRWERLAAAMPWRRVVRWKANSVIECAIGTPAKTLQRRRRLFN